MEKAEAMIAVSATGFGEHLNCRDHVPDLMEALFTISLFWASHYVSADLFIKVGVYPSNIAKMSILSVQRTV